MKILKYMIITLLFASALLASNPSNCLVFTDNDDYVYIDDSPLRFTTKFTIECWFNIQEFSNSAALIDFSTQHIYQDRVYGYGIYTMTDNRIAIRMGNSSRAAEMVIDDIKENIWYHLAVTYDKFKKDENLIAFLNGRVVKKIDCDIYLDYPETFRPYGVMLGAYYDYPFLKAFKGQLDDVRFWSLVRTNEQIRHNLSGDISADSPGLAGYYTFDQDADTLAYDAGPNENHGKLLNMTSDSWQLSYAQLAVEPPHDVSFDRIVLPWASSSSFESYCVDMSADTGFSTSLNGYPKFNVETDYHIACDLDPGTYYFRVKGHHDGETIELEPWTDIQMASTLSDVPTPIDLSEFTATLNQNTINVTWETSSQTENALFVLERSTDDVEWIDIFSTPGEGTTSKKCHYGYMDDDILGGQTYRYRLKDVSYSGKIGLSDVLEITAEEIQYPAIDSPFISIFPNPFNPSTRIRLDLAQNTDINLAIYAIDGRLVHEILKGEISPGSYAFDWQPVAEPSGLYLLNAFFNGESHSYKLLYFK